MILTLTEFHFSLFELQCLGVHYVIPWLASSQPPVVEQFSIDGGLLQIFLQLLLFNLQKREDIRVWFLRESEREDDPLPFPAGGRY